jgi:hypothetical protein
MSASCQCSSLGLAFQHSQHVCHRPERFDHHYQEHCIKRDRSNMTVDLEESCEAQQRNEEGPTSMTTMAFSRPVS